MNMCLNALVHCLPVWVLQRAAVYDMTVMRRITYNPEERVVHAPNVVVLHPEPGDAFSNGVKGDASSSTKHSRVQATYQDARQYLDEYGYDVTPYDKECTADLQGLYDAEFGVDTTVMGDGEGVAACDKYGLVVAVAWALWPFGTYCVTSYLVSMGTLTDTPIHVHCVCL